MNLMSRILVFYPKCETDKICWIIEIKITTNYISNKLIKKYKMKK